MSQKRAPGAVQERARRILLHMLGTNGLWATVTVLLLVTSMAWFTDATYEWIVDAGNVLNGKPVQELFPPHRVLSVVLFAGVLAVLGWQAKGGSQRYRPRVTIDNSPRRVPGLILFLSNLRQDDRQELEDGIAQLAHIDNFRTRHGKLNWRMPLEAIAYHEQVLKRVIVITSEGASGSATQWELFKKVVRRSFPTAGFQLECCTDLARSYAEGLDFEDVDLVSQVTDDAYESLRISGLDTSQILIDITGGLKPNAVAATAVALAEGRRIQYVTCHRESGECRVKAYDVTYEH